MKNEKQLLEEKKLQSKICFESYYSKNQERKKEYQKNYRKRNKDLKVYYTDERLQEIRKAQLHNSIKNANNAWLKKSDYQETDGFKMAGDPFCEEFINKKRKKINW